MGRYKWIQKEGSCDAAMLNQVISEELAAYDYVMLLYIDAFECIKREDLRQVDVKRLLEMRAFSEAKEFYAYRGGIGEGFEWRIAISDGLAEHEDYLIQYHFIDINEKKIDGHCTSDGNPIFYTTVGGQYSLPIDVDKKRVRIMEYITYDDNGMARIADARICGFYD